MASVQKEVKELIDAVRSTGHTVAIDNDAAHILWRGEPVQFEGKNITLHLTPSDARWRKNAVAMLKRAGILQEDPKEREMKRERAEERKTRRVITEEMRANSRLATMARARTNEEKSNDLRERIKVIYEVLGGKQRIGLLKRLGQAGWQLAEEAGAWHPETMDATTQSIGFLLRGSTIGEKPQEMWNRLAEALNTNTAVEFEYILDRYKAASAVRSASQNGSAVEPEVPMSEATLDAAEDAPENPEPVVRLIDVGKVVEEERRAAGLPEVAFKALARMARAGDIDDAIEVARDIARLELLRS